MIAQIRGDALAGCPAYSRADFLHRDHQRIGEQHRPGNGEAELRPYLRVSRDTARIIIRRTSDQSGAKHLEQPRL
jgi:hypothetical protein